MLRLVTIAALICAAMPAVAAEPGEPPLTERTAETGLPLTPDSNRCISAPPISAGRSIRTGRPSRADALLTLKVEKPVAAMQFDLDRNLPVSAVAIGGKALPALGNGAIRRVSSPLPCPANIRQARS